MPRPVTYGYDRPPRDPVIAAIVVVLLGMIGGGAWAILQLGR
jgi:hypothetical protein